MLTLPSRSRTLVLALTAFLAGLLSACESNIVAMRPLIHTTTWVPDSPPPPAPTTAPATQVAASQPTATTTASTQFADSQPATQVADTQPTTAPSTQSADALPTTMSASTTQSSTQPTTRLALTKPAATRPGHQVTIVTDPNETARYIYKADYDYLWKQSLGLLDRAGFLFDRLDYRLGVMTTKPLPSAQFIEFWKPEHTTFKNALENAVNNQRRIVRITIAPDPAKPDFYRIAVQVGVERQTNPGEDLSGPLFVEGSAYGRSSLSVRSDYIPVHDADNSAWVLVGRDPNLEHKLLNALFKRI